MPNDVKNQEYKTTEQEKENLKKLAYIMYELFNQQKQKK
jgi:hypothetical protein